MPRRLTSFTGPCGLIRTIFKSSPTPPMCWPPMKTRKSATAKPRSCSRSRRNVLTGGAQPFVLDALGMACAETGHFDEAQAVAQKALDLAQACRNVKNLDGLQQRLEFYKKRQPWRESFLATNAPPQLFRENQPSP